MKGPCVSPYNVVPVLLVLVIATLGNVPMLALAAPTMVVSMTRDGNPVNPSVEPAIGADVPITMTWTLEDAPVDAEWQGCSIPLDAPISIDEVTPSATSTGSSSYTFAPETRTVTIGFHGTSLTASNARYQVMQCRATLANGTDVYENAVFQIGPIPTSFVHLPLILR